jgi:hypothetical protein
MRNDPRKQSKNRGHAIPEVPAYKSLVKPFGAVRIRPSKFMSFGLKGSADILGLLPGGRFLAVECKAEHGRLSPEQRQFLAVVKALGGPGGCGKVLAGYRPGVT